MIKENNKRFNVTIPKECYDILEIVAKYYKTTKSKLIKILLDKLFIDMQLLTKKEK